MAYFQSYEEAKRYLYSLKHHGAKYGLERMRFFSDALGRPERSYPVIHVAGTNGKGSVCAHLEAIYRKNGYKTGLFTSPHLIRQGERAQVDRQPMSEEAIVEHAERLRAIAEAVAACDPDGHPSFFEFMAAMAFERFKSEQVDVAIVETGLGGRLDATNIVDPELSIITSISLDHTDLLGPAIEDIAYEKAGIVKMERPVLVGRLPERCESIIRHIAFHRDSPFHSIRDRFGDSLESYPQSSLKADFQRWNAGMALRASELLNSKLPVDPDTAREALTEVEWAGRWDTRMVDGRKIILDSAHNPEGAAMLAKCLRRLIDEEGEKPIIACGALGEFRAAALMPVIAASAREIHLLKPAQPRACSFEEMEGLLGQCDAPTFRSRARKLFPAKGKCAVGAPGDTIVVCGSIYLIGEVMEAMLCESPANEAMLQDNPLPRAEGPLTPI